MNFAQRLFALSTPLLAGVVVSASAVPAATPAPGSAPASTPGVIAPGPGPVSDVAPALAAQIRERVAARVGGEPGEVHATPIGLYEVYLDGEILYVDEKVNYLIAGRLFDMRTKQDLTTPRKEELQRIDFGALPFPKAVKTVHGTGARQIAVFEDPNCPYCKRFEHDIATIQDVTIYTFLYPILSDDSVVKSRAVWCSPDQAEAWMQLMQQGRALAPAAEACKGPMDEILLLGQKLHVTGTPTLFFTDGRRAPGAIPLERVNKMISEAAATSARPTATR